MKSWLRYLLLAVVGFGLGSGFAYVQNTKEAPPVAVEAAAGDAHQDHQHASPPVQAESPVAGVQVGGPFTLTDHSGKPVTEKSWPGKHKLVFFGFTHCPDICIGALERLSIVMNNFDKNGEKLQPLFVTVDPERDTPEVIAKFLSNYNPHVVGLTGTKEQIAEVEAAYRVYASKIQPGEDPHAYMMNHSSYVYFMSPDDKLLEVIGSDESGEKMIERIKLHIP